MEFPKILLAVLFLIDFSNATFLPRSNVSSLPPLKQQGKKGSGVLKLPITKVEKTSNTSSPGRRQESSVIYNINIAYIIQASIGTPPQLVDVTLDTGSSELWVDPDCANSYDPTYCASFPVYDPNTSSTEQDVGETFGITYGTGSVSGEYLTDTVLVGGADLTGQQFGWAETSSFAALGIMGVGLGYDWNLDYYNIIDNLYVEGYTASRAFGLDLASADSTTGSIIFGGIDTNKYIGSLYTSPMIPWYDSPDFTPRYWFYMTSVGVTEPGSTTSTILTSSTYEQPMFPDCGATLSQLPPNLFTALISFFPTAVDSGNGVYTIDCSIRNQAGSLDFGFGTKIIHVTYHEWFRQVDTTCYFGGVSNPNVFSLGDSFMRSAYIVYDQDNFNIHIAQAADCGTNIVPIGSGTDAVPSIVGACTSTSSSSSSSSTASTTSSSVRTSSSSTKTTTTSSTHSSTSSTSSKLSTSSTSSKPSSTSSTHSSTSSTSSKLSTSSTSSKPSSTSSTHSSVSSTTSKQLSSSSTSSKISMTSSSQRTGSSTSSKTSSSSKSSTSSKVSTTSSVPKSTSSSTKISSTSSSANKSSTSSNTSKTTSTLTSKSSSTSATKTTGSVVTTTVYITVSATGTCTSVGQVY